MTFTNDDNTLVGMTFGDCTLTELMGVGGMGAVYRAKQTSLKREVAVKVLLEDTSAAPGYKERFEREAETAARLEHTHIVPIYAYGTQNGISYVVMRMLTGGTLSQRNKQRKAEDKPLPSLGETAQLLDQLASALDYAHSGGVIHRDIKPSNVMFDNWGSAFIVDFGIAKIRGSASELTGTGVAMGTASYMPPEQWRDSKSLTPAADQYALAMVVYELVTGQIPFDVEESDMPQLLYKAFNEMPKPPQEIRPELPEALNFVFARALAKEPADRYPSIAAFAAAFREAVQGHEGDATDYFTFEVEAQDVDLRTTVSRSSHRAYAYTPSEIPAYTPPSTPFYRNPVILGIGLVILLLAAILAVLVIPRGDDSASLTSTAVAAAAGNESATAAALLALVPTETDTPSPSDTPASSDTPIPSDTPTETASQTPSETPTETPSLTPTDAPTATTTPRPTSTMNVSSAALLHVGSVEVPLLVAPNDGAAQLAMIAEVTVPILNRTADGRFLLVEYQEQRGWIANSVDSNIEGSLNAVPVSVVLPTQAPTRTPMVVFSGPTFNVADLGATLYAAPFISAQVIATTPPQISLPIVGKTADVRYLLLAYDEARGWVLLSEAEGEIVGDLSQVPVITLGPSLAATRSVPTAVSELNAASPAYRVGGLGVTMRSEPNATSARIATIATVLLPIIGKTADGSYLLVDYEGQQGWIRASISGRVEGSLDDVPIMGPTPTATRTPSLTPTPILGPAYRVSGLGVTLRSEPNATSARIATIASAILPIIGKTADGSYLLVDYEGQQGWIRASISGRVEGNLDDVPVVTP